MGDYLSYFFVGAFALIIGFAIGGLTAESIIEDDYYEFNDEEDGE